MCRCIPSLWNCCACCPPHLVLDSDNAPLVVHLHLHSAVVHGGGQNFKQINSGRYITECERPIFRGHRRMLATVQNHLVRIYGHQNERPWVGASLISHGKGSSGMFHAPNSRETIDKPTVSRKSSVRLTVTSSNPQPKPRKNRIISQGVSERCIWKFLE